MKETPIIMTIIIPNIQGPKLASDHFSQVSTSPLSTSALICEVNSSSEIFEFNPKVSRRTLV